MHVSLSRILVSDVIRFLTQISRAFTNNSRLNMAPVSKPKNEEYDFLVIGGGSGGMGASVRRD